MGCACHSDGGNKKRRTLVGIILRNHLHRMDLQDRNIVQGKGKAVPLQAWTGPEGSRKLRLPDFMTTAQDGGRLSALCTGRLYPPGNTPGTHFGYRLSRPQGHSAIGRILCQ